MSEIINRTIPISLIDEHPRNYRHHPVSQLKQFKKSREEFDQYQSLVVWARPGGRYTLVVGHGRTRAWEEDGVGEVRADILPEDTPPEKIEAILAADYTLSRLAQNNDAGLNQILKEQLQAGRSDAALGLSKQETEKLLHSLLAEQKTDFLSSVLASPGVPLPVSTREPGRSLPEQQAFPSTSDDEIKMMNLPLSSEERTVLLTAISRAKQRRAGLQTQAQALTWICQQFLGQG